jgi:PAS domain S-box-containing protein
VSTRRAEPAGVPEEGLRRLFEAAPVPLALARLDDGALVLVNPAAVVAFELEPGPPAGTIFALFANPADAHTFMRALVSHGRVDRLEAELRTARGRSLWAGLSASLLEYHGEQVMLALVADLTERVAAARALRESEERFRVLAENAPLGIYRHDPEAHCLYTNRRWSEISGMSAEEARGHGWFRVVHPDDLPGAGTAFRAALAGDGRFRHELRFVRPDGEVRWISILSGPLYGPGGEITGHVGSIDDISERRRSEEARREGEAKLRLVLDTIPVRVFWKDRDSVYRGCNRMVAQDCGLSGPDEIVGKTDFDLGYREAAAFQADDRRVMESGTPKINYEEPVTTAEGRAIWARTSKFPLRGPTGEVVGVLGTFEDVTERKEVEERHRLLAERLSLATQAAAIGTWDLEVASGAFEVDAQFVALYGGPAPGTPAERLWTERVHEHDRARCRERRRAALAGETPGYDDEFRVVWPDGSLRYLRNLGRLVRDDQGRPLRFVGVTMDVTAARRAQEDARRLNAELERRVEERTAQLTAANRELESFSYSVSHDLRAPLRAIDGFSQALMEDYGRAMSDEARGHLRRVRQASQRMGQLIDDILELSRTARAELRRRRVSLSAVAEAVLAQLQAAHPARVVTARVEAGLEADADESLSRVLLENLLGNAWKYTGKKPAARIAFGRTAKDGRDVFFVEDDGDGFEMTYAHKLFGPFQRLHGVEEFEGTGIGLATVRRIVERHGGAVWGEGRPGQGATFYFTLGAGGAGRETG